MTDCPLPTAFAPAERSTKNQLLADARLFQTSAASEVLDAMPSPVLVLNDCRQLVHANRSLWLYLDRSGADQALGLRPGELFDCVHARKTPGGCGTTEFCRECGAVGAILSSIRGLAATRECNMLREAGGEVTALDLLVHAEPFASLGRPLTIFTIHDVSHAKRRRYLERIFFHDIINSAGNATGLVELLHEQAEGGQRHELRLLLRTLTHLVDEIQSQKTLLAAESQELVARPVRVRSDELLEALAEQYAHLPRAEGRTIVVNHDSEALALVTDPALLGRVLGNMIKNALEATPAGGSVRAWCRAEDGRVRFFVHNQGCIPRPIQRQIFRRSFSSKGQDRGLGTFSMLMLAQNHLGGTVRFTSTEAEGTVFLVDLPRVLDKP